MKFLYTFFCLSRLLCECVLVLIRFSLNFIKGHSQRDNCRVHKTLSAKKISSDNAPANRKRKSEILNFSRFTEQVEWSERSE